MKLSLCIAAFNEEKFIHYPLDSAYDLVDEVVIVDGGSEDKTVEIAKSYGGKVRVIETDNPPMFHKNKQKAIQAAKGEWILQLDADEALSDKLKEELSKIMRGGGGGRDPDSAQGYVASTGGRETSDRTPSNFVAYWLPRKNFFLTRFLEKGGQYPDYTIRLYKNGVAEFPCKTVHEQVEVKGEIGYLKNPLLHYADPDFSRYLNRWDRYTSMDAELLVKQNKKLCFPCYFFGKPFAWFLNTYIRHAGFKDGFPGFVFSLFSAIRFWAIYVKWWQMREGGEKV